MESRFGKKNILGKLWVIFRNILVVIACFAFMRFTIFSGAGGAMSDGDAVIMNIAYVVLFAIFIAFFYIAVYFHTVVHEFGHLVGGLLSGYKFISFRVNKMMFIIENGALSRKKYSVPETKGHCMMSPPEPVDGKFPFVFYLLSGSLMNFFVCIGLLALARVVVVESVPYITLFFHSLFAVGVSLGLLNILPLKMKGPANDGLTARLLTKSFEARESYRIALLVIAGMTQGIRFKDMPAEWFAALESLGDVAAVNASLRRFDFLMDTHSYTEAKVFVERFLAENRHLSKLHKNELTCELLFLEIIGERRLDVIEGFITADLLKYIKSRKYHLSKLRLVYAYEKLVSRDCKRASAALDRFNRHLLRYPYASEMELERELIAAIDSISVSTEAVLT